MKKGAMRMQTKAWLTLLYGLWVLSGGVWRYVESGSNAALGFGLTTGLMALLGGVLFFMNKRMAAALLTGLATVFVAGFFGVKAAKQPDELSIRVIVTLAASIAELVVLILPLQEEVPSEARGLQVKG